MQNIASHPRRIAILGGGISSLVTAFELSSQPGWRERYEITLYQQGHKLGGKCASVRTRDDVGAECVERIEEHGLHVFFGFYENAFQIMRRCYTELDQTRAHEVARGEAPETNGLTMETAFHPHDLIMMGASHDGKIKSWPIPFPRRAGEPGTQTEVPKGSFEDDSLLDGGTILAGLLELSTAYLLQLAGALSASGDENAADVVAQIDGDLSDHGQPTELVTSIMKAVGKILGLLPPSLVARTVPKMAKIALDPLKRWGDGDGLRQPWLRKVLVKQLSLLRDTLMRATAGLTADYRAVQLRAGVDLSLTLAIGLLAEDLLHQKVDWFELDALDYRDWLRQHGADESTIVSAPIETLAAAAFSDGPYGGGGAGTCLHLTLRMLLTYKRAIVHRLGAGMGETIVAPLYRVLRERGVRFAFFHRIEGLERGEREGMPVVERILFRKQANVVGGGQYQPLELFNGMYCFPKEPRYAQLEEGAALRGHELDSFWNAWDPQRPIEALELGRDFDICILGISVGALGPLCRDLTDHEPMAWPDGTPTLRATIEKLRTVETMAAQLWFKPSFADLDAPSSSGVGIAYPQPFDTWADMQHVLTHERWPRAHRPGSVVYLCSSIELPPDAPQPLDPTDTAHPERQRALVRGLLHGWLDRYGPQIFSKVRTQEQRFDYETLIDVKARTGAARLDAQFSCATVHPSDRYVLAVAGTSKYRLRSHQSGYENLVLAGDWTLNPFAAGCVESAVSSGREAARVVCGRPDWIFGDWLSVVRGAPPRALIARMPEYPSRAARPRHLTSLPTQRMPLESERPLRDSMVVPAGKTAFVRRPFDLLPRPPYACKDALTSWFFFRADAEKLTRLVDDGLNAVINDPSGPHYEPLVPMVAFVAAELEKLYSLRDRYGWMPEKDFAFWIPVRVVQPGKPTRFAWYQPGLWVDSGPAVTGGREALGMNKALARLTANDDGFAIDTIALRKLDNPLLTGEPVAEASEERILEVRTHKNGDVWLPVSSLSSILTVFSSLPGWLQIGDDSRKWLSTLFAQLRDQEVSIVSLKQFPEVDGSNDACYQSIVEYPSRAQNIHEMLPRFAGAELVVFPFESHPIVSSLGLETLDQLVNGQPAKVARSVLAMTVRFDFTIEPGRVVAVGRLSEALDMLAASAH